MIVEESSSILEIQEETAAERGSTYSSRALGNLQAERTGVVYKPELSIYAFIHSIKGKRPYPPQNTFSKTNRKMKTGDLLSKETEQSLRVIRERSPKTHRVMV